MNSEKHNRIIPGVRLNEGPIQTHKKISENNPEQKNTGIEQRKSQKKIS